MHKRPLRGHCAPVLAVNPANHAAPAACVLGDLHSKGLLHVSISRVTWQARISRGEVCRKSLRAAALFLSNERAAKRQNESTMTKARSFIHPALSRGTPQPSSERNQPAFWLFCASIAIAACMSTFSRVYASISLAISASSSVDFASVRFSLCTVRLLMV